LVFLLFYGYFQQKIGLFSRYASRVP
jgi:hypothetical protein